MKLRILDWIVIVACAAGIAVSAAFVYGGGNSSSRVVISGKDGEWVYPLDKDSQVEVSGPLGITRVGIEGGAVHIEDSPCPNKTCLAAGSIRDKGQWLACLPNAVFVRIEGGKTEAGVDASVY